MIRLKEPGSPVEPGISRINRIPIHECGEPLVDLQDTRSGMVFKARLTLLRTTAAHMLERAQASLPPNIVIRVNTALRTLETQSTGYFKHLENLREKHPEWPYPILRREANRFWHPPDQKAPPGHCTGGAVDVTLMVRDGDEIDMTTTTRPEVNANPTLSRYLTSEVRCNRQMLITAMSNAGFSNCADEWWHWSYGDSAWAARLGHAYAIYGAVPESSPGTDSDKAPEVGASTP